VRRAEKEATEFATKLINIQLSFINTDLLFGLANWSGWRI
jgi:hypothetical protein